MSAPGAKQPQTDRDATKTSTKKTAESSNYIYDIFYMAILIVDFNIKYISYLGNMRIDAAFVC